ncbi:MAG: DUF1810 domain-containing protein [Ignavibacteriaceae bacterium]|nr:DUF1810 domain-containing protein [Ignavibacteriaceae bacterium]
MKYNLQRFLDAQNSDYKKAFDEISHGKKTGHWMWYIFPQLKGLGNSHYAVHYGIANIEEAEEFLNHNILGIRLIEISELLLSLNQSNPVEIFGVIDSLKLKSCMTLFGQVNNKSRVFEEVLKKYFAGIPDKLTLDLLIKNKKS